MVNDTAREIRSRFRSRMDGVIAENMRKKGVDYHVNWGVSLLHLRDLAADYQQDKNVALELWNDRVRESKIMALLLMPVSEFTPDVADKWIETLGTQEIAEMAAMLLFHNLTYSAQLAVRLISADDELQQILGYNIISRRASRGDIGTAKELETIVAKIKTALKDGRIAVAHAARNCFLKLDCCDKLADTPDWHVLCEGVE